MNYDYLRNIDFFRILEPLQIEKLMEKAVLENYNKGQVLFYQAKSREFVHIILSGWIKLIRQTLDGKEIILGLLKNDSIIWESNIEERIHSFEARTITNTKIIKFPYKIFCNIVKNNSLASFKLISSLNSNIRQLNIQLEHISTMKAQQRIACFLLRLINKPSIGNIEIILPYDKNIIACYLGMQRETFSRALNELKNHGLVIKGNKFIINNIQSLMDICCVSCSLTYDICRD